MTKDSRTGGQADDQPDEDERLDPRIVNGWQALESGDIDTAKQAAASVLAQGEATDPEAGGGGAAEASRLDALLLAAACAREENDAESALEHLALAAEEDPEWCTPELWMAELLSEDPERLDEALRHARRALDHAEEEDEYLDALRCKAAIELDLGRPTEARKTLSGLPPADVPLDDPSATLDFAQLLMDAGDPAEARERLTALTEAHPRLADGWYLLGAVAELLNDEEAKRAAWLTTRALDLEAMDRPGGAGDGEAPARSAAPDLSLTEDALIAVAEEALAEMPPELRAQMKNVPIVVAEMPAAADVAAGLDPRLLGLFSGSPHAQSAAILGPPELTEIILFRANIERFAVDEEALRDEVRTTLLHEAGHFFGLDEAALARLGLA